MNFLILSDSDVSEIESLNATGDPNRQLRPVPLTDGRHALNSDILDDCAPSQTWHHYAALLQSLSQEDLLPDAFPTPDL